MSNNFRLIGIGASAGGVKAIQEFFVNIADATAHSFVVIQHFPSNHQNRMGSILKKHSNLPVIIVEEAVTIKKGHIYLMSPLMNLIAEDGILKPQAKNPNNLLNLPIDVFFTTLSQEYKEDAIGIILSGTGSDGMKGIRKIKEKGGLVVLQDPMEAEFNSMPMNAIRTDLVDSVLPINRMSEGIFDFIAKSTLFMPNAEGVQDYIQRILTHIKNVKEVDFIDYKLPTILRFVDRRMILAKIDSLKSYFEYIINTPEETNILFKGFLINVTGFFRDPQVWEELKSKHLVELIKSKAASDEVLKVWTVGCSTGEEIYTLAIVIHEIMSEHNIHCEVKMFGTDLSRDPIEFAKRGIYTASLVSDMPQEYLDRYFVLEEGNFRIRSFIRNKIVFAEHNIIRDFPFHKIDIISCRNLIIYFNVKLQEEVISIFNNAINLNGILILGSSETINKKTSLFAALDPGLRIYKNLKKGKPIYLLNKLSYRSHHLRPKIIKETTPSEDFKKRITELFVAELNVVSLLIDNNFQILSSMGKAKDILIFPDEGFTSYLTQMLPKNISLLITSSLRNLNQSNNIIRYQNIIYQGNNISYYDIILQYVPNIFEIDIKTYMIVFIPSRKVYKTSESSEQKKLEEVPISRLEELEDELSLTKKNLEYFVKDLELNNEELQTANEELLATNEQLKSSNEELQSVNEELHTMNSEFQQKLIEIENMNSDMDNLLRSTDIGTIFLDKDMLIRKFTPAAKEQFNLTINDLGRPLSHFTSNFATPDYHKTLERILATTALGTESDQKEIKTNNGKIYLQRINPFINSAGDVLGTVISYVDISPIKKLEAHLKETAEKLNIVLKYAKSTITMLDLAGTVLYVNRVLSSIDKEKYINSSIYDFTSNEISNTLKENIEVVKKTKEHMVFQYVITTPNGEKLHYYNTLSPIISDENVTGIVILTTDVSEIKSIQITLEQNNKELERKNKELEEFAYIASHDLREPIRTILGFTEVIQRELKHSDNKKINQGLSYISDSVIRMQGLVNGLLEYSRIGQEKKNDYIDLNELVNFILEDLQQSVEDTKAMIEVSPLPTVSGYPLALRMVFQNLITNAIKFSQQDAKPIIKIGVEEQKGAWLFHITDNGIGIPEKFYEKIFLIFQRLNHSEYKKGSGIGLSLCKKYIELHKGDIWLKSEINKGTTFYFTLGK